MSSKKHSSHHSSKDSSQKDKNKSLSSSVTASTNYITTSDYWCEMCALHIQNCRCVPYDQSTVANWQNNQDMSSNYSTAPNSAYFDHTASTWITGNNDDKSYYADSTGNALHIQTTGEDNSQDYQQTAGTGNSKSTDSDRRQKANRNSQRKHRLNQMKVVEDLKYQVSDLENQNQMMSNQIFALDQDEIHQAGNGGDAGRM